MMSKAQVKAVRRRLVAAGHADELLAMQAQSKVRQRTLQDCLVLLGGDVGKLRTLHSNWHMGLFGVPNNVSLSSYIRYVLRCEAAQRNKTDRPYGRRP